MSVVECAIVSRVGVAGWCKSLLEIEKKALFHSNLSR